MIFRLLILSVVLCVMLISFILFLNKSTSHPVNPHIIESDCSLGKKPCLISIQPNQDVSFKIEPYGLPVMEPITLSISGLNLSPETIKVWFEGRDMNMGKHYMLPITTDFDELKTEIQLKGMIPICTIDTDMIWRLTVEFLNETELYQVHFFLKTDVDH